MEQKEYVSLKKQYSQIIGGNIGALASQDDTQEIQVWHTRNNRHAGRLSGLSAYK